MPGSKTVIRFPAHEMKARSDAARKKFSADFLTVADGTATKRDRRPIPIAELFNRPGLLPFPREERIRLYGRGELKPSDTSQGGTDADEFSNSGPAAKIELPVLLGDATFKILVSIPDDLRIIVRNAPDDVLEFAPISALEMEVAEAQPGAPVDNGKLSLQRVAWTARELVYTFARANGELRLELVLDGKVSSRLYWGLRRLLSDAESPCPDPTGLDTRWFVARHKTDHRCVVVQFKDFDGEKWEKQSYAFKDRSKAEEELRTLKLIPGFCSGG